MQRGNRAVAPVLVGLLLAATAMGAALPVQAQGANWTSVVSIKDLTGNVVLTQGAPLIAGDTYNATVQISVPLTQSNSEFQVALNPNLTKSASQFWYIDTPRYAGFNNTMWTPSLKTVAFDQVLGTLVLSALFQVPVNLTVTSAGGLDLHFAQETFPLVSVTVTSGTPGGAGVVVVPLSDQSIQTYLDTYQAKSTLISSGLVDRSYSTLLSGALNVSQALYRAGLTEQATSLLDDFTPTTLPSPPNSSYVSYLVGALILVAVLAASLSLVYLRGRGKAGYSEGVVNEINRQLASLEVVAARYDKTLADNLKAVRQKLEETS